MRRRYEHDEAARGDTLAASRFAYPHNWMLGVGTDDSNGYCYSPGPCGQAQLLHNQGAFSMDYVSTSEIQTDYVSPPANHGLIVKDIVHAPIIYLRARPISAMPTAL